MINTANRIDCTMQSSFVTLS